MGIVQLSMFDGKVCPKCGDYKAVTCFGLNKSRKDGLQAYCKECRHIYAITKGRELYYDNIEKSREVSRLWYHENKEKLKDGNRKRAKEWYQNNTDRAKASRARLYQENAEENRAKSRGWYYQNIERARIRRKSQYDRDQDKARAYSKQWYVEHKKYVSEYHKKYKKFNARRVNEYNRRRYARKRGNGGSYTVAEWDRLCGWFGNKCLMCGSSELTADHVIPIVKGGTNYIDNIQPLCKICNSKKGTDSTDYRDPDRLAAFLEIIHDQEILSGTADSSNAIR